MSARTDAPATRAPAVGRRALLLAGVVGAVGHLAGMCADVASGYAPRAVGAAEHMYALSLDQVAPLLAHKSHAALVWGHYVALLGIPLGIAGLWQVYHALGGVRSRWATLTFLLGTNAYVYGTVLHITIGFLGAGLRLVPGPALGSGAPPAVRLQPFADFYGPVSVIAVAGISAVFLAIAVPVARGRTLYPRWFVWVNPLVFQFLFGALILLLPPPADILLFVIEFNASAFLFYAGSTLVLWKVLPPALPRRPADEQP